MPYVEVWVDEDALDEATDEELIEELQRRGKMPKSKKYSNTFDLAENLYRAAISSEQALHEELDDMFIQILNKRPHETRRTS